MGIIDRVIDGLCDLEKTAQTDDFFARAKSAAGIFESAAQVAQRIKEGLHPHPMGFCNAEYRESALDGSRNIRDFAVVAKYDKFREAIEDFWVICLARLLDDIQKATDNGLLHFRKTLLDDLPTTVFPPGAQLHRYHDASIHHDDERRTAPEKLRRSRENYIEHLLRTLPNVDPEGRLDIQAERDAQEAGSEDLSRASMGSALSAAIVARTLTLYAGKYGDPVTRLLDPDSYSSNKLSRIVRGQTIFPTSSELKSVWVDAVIDHRLGQLIAQRESYLGQQVPDTLWQTLKVQPGRYGDHFNPEQGAVLTPGRIEHFYLAVTCSIVDHELGKYPAARQRSSWTFPKSGSQDMNNPRARSLMQAQAQVWLDEHGYGRAFAEALRQADDTSNALKKRTEATRFASSGIAQPQALSDLLSSGAIELIPSLDWHATRDAYIAELKVHWQLLDPTNQATFLEMVVLARSGERFQLLPHEADDLGDDWISLCIPAWCFGDLTPVEIRQRLVQGLWGAHSDGERLVVCVVMNLPYLAKVTATD